MESMVSRWQKALQAVDQPSLSRLTASRTAEGSAKHLKEPAMLSEMKDSKASAANEERNKDSRGRSNEQKNASRENRMTSGKKAETPKGERRGRKEKVIEGTANAIIELFAPANPDKVRLRLRSLLENLLLQAQEKSEPMMSESTLSRPAERAYNQLQQRYLQSQKQRQYLRGKLQVSAKRTEGLQRELQRYGKVQRLIDQSISREAELKQELARVQLQRSLMQQTMRQQRDMWEREVSEVRQLMDSLRLALPKE